MTKGRPHLICPHCHNRLDLLQALAEEDLRDLMVTLAGFGSYRGLVLSYLELFRARPGAVIQTSRMLKLSREVAKLWEQQGFAFDGKSYHIERAQIAEALAETVRAQPENLDNHNYLKKVMRGKLGQVERQERRQEAQAEVALEAQRRAGQHRQESPAALPPAGDEQPIWEQPLEDQVVVLACCYKSPMLSGAGWKPRLEGSLRAAGVDLEALRTLAQRAERADTWTGRGAELLRRCRAGNHDPAPVGDCLPGLGGA